MYVGAVTGLGARTPPAHPPELQGLISCARCLVHKSGISGFSHIHRECHLLPLVLQHISPPVPHRLSGGDRALKNPPGAPRAQCTGLGGNITGGMSDLSPFPKLFQPDQSRALTFSKHKSFTRTQQNTLERPKSSPEWLVTRSVFVPIHISHPERSGEAGRCPPRPHLLGLERMLASSSLELSRRMSLEGCVSSSGNRLM